MMRIWFGSTDGVQRFEIYLAGLLFLLICFLLPISGRIAFVAQAQRKELHSFVNIISAVNNCKVKCYCRGFFLVHMRLSRDLEFLCSTHADQLLVDSS